MLMEAEMKNSILLSLAIFLGVAAEALAQCADPNPAPAPRPIPSPIPPRPVPAPPRLTATTINRHQIGLTWTRIPGLIRLTIERSLYPDRGFAPIGSFTQPGIGVAWPWIDSTVQPRLTYFYRLRAFTSYGTLNSNVAFAATFARPRR
jgi:hypothetical protein